MRIPSAAVCIVALSLLSQAADAELRLGGSVSVSIPAKARGVALAAQDLTRDLQKVLGAQARAVDGEAAQILVRIDPALKRPESWRIEITDSRVAISGADTLGAIYGIYAFSHECLGVDPFWYWKGIEPARRNDIALSPRVIQSTPAAFRLRGWFINDEDLLTEWKKGSGPRFIEYPYYHTVISTEIADSIFEALLRSGGNLVIPASFVDVMNEPEAALVKRAVERGLYVTQHHIEPMGMSFFGFEHYWKSRGEKISLSYGKTPEKVHETWRAYAKKWREIAGDQVIWQIGLRGRGDRPVWASDKTVTETDAGRTISRAMAEQAKIVKEVDPRPNPPITTTLWHEMSKLMSKGVLEIPPGVCFVFCDEGSTQRLQEDFARTPRTPERKCGAYLHLAFWKNGPHLVQGTDPRRLKAEIDKMVTKGDAEYAIINVSNIREHLLGVKAAMSMMQSPGDWDYDRFMSAWAPAPVRQGYDQFFAAMADTGAMLIQDGHCYTMGEALLAAHGKRQKASLSFFQSVEKSGADELAKSIQKLDQLIAGLDERVKNLPENERRFYRNNLLVQARMLRDLYVWVHSLALAFEDPSKFAEAQRALERFIEQRKEAENGKWAGWYTGDKKANVPRLLERTAALAKSRSK